MTREEWDLGHLKHGVLAFYILERWWLLNEARFYSYCGVCANVVMPPIKKGAIF